MTAPLPLPRRPFRFLDDLGGFIEREAGHIMVSFALIALGAVLWFFKVPKGEDLIPFATGVMARSMIGTKPTSNAPAPAESGPPPQQPSLS